MPGYFPNGNQFYMQDLQAMREKIDSQMRNLQQQNQIQQPMQQPITQNFQLAPNNTLNELESRYANSIDEVRNILVIKTGLFINKDFSKLWVKDISGNIRTFNLEEEIELDEKDKEIQELKMQIEEMKGMILNANDSSDADVVKSTSAKKSTRTSTTTKSNAK